MTVRDRLAIAIGKLVSRISKSLRLGAGATWPGEIVLMLSPDILGPLCKQVPEGIILVAGTNGKTTTSLMIKTVLEKQGKRVVHNKSGANLLNGIVSACIEQSLHGVMEADIGVFEVDENSLPIVLRYATPKTLVLLNLFRDQLDRYGEVDIIAEKWLAALSRLDERTTLVLNADDPLVAFLGKKTKTNAVFFGVDDTSLKASVMEHATDSTFCLFCGSRLSYKTVYFSHIGDWYCSVCGEKRPKLNISRVSSPLPGLYNLYNTLAAVLTASVMHISKEDSARSLADFRPAFGRQEEISVDGKKVKLFLSKNPAGFNASLRTVLEFHPHALLFVLNDRIPDGRDVSWIWDVDFEKIPKQVAVVVSGDRVYDMAVRIKYASDMRGKPSGGRELYVEPELSHGIKKGLTHVPDNGTLYVLPTYSAMLEVRKILSGKKIL